jgi:hypothetical protein
MGDIIRVAKLKKDVVIPLPPLPSALFPFSATPFSSTIIDLTWIDFGPYATQYDLEWGTDPTFAVKTSVTLPATPNSSGLYTLTGLISGTQYYFRIRATNAAGSSAWASASATTP